jgi:hypothetical protein
VRRRAVAGKYHAVVVVIDQDLRDYTPFRHEDFPWPRIGQWVRVILPQLVIARGVDHKFAVLQPPVWLVLGGPVAVPVNARPAFILRKIIALVCDPVLLGACCRETGARERRDED